jgi:hypothetical protein
MTVAARGDRKRIGAFGRMRDRATSGDRIAHMDEDVREVTDHLRRTLLDKAATMTVLGFAVDEESYEFAINGRIVIGSVIVYRA